MQQLPSFYRSLGWLERSSMALGCFFSIPSVVIGNKAKQITNQIPGHPDSGMAKAAVVVGWVGIAIGGLYALLVIGLIAYFIIAF